MFIMLIINSRPRLTGATCFPLLGQLQRSVTPALPSKESAWNWLRSDAHWQRTNKSACLIHSTLKGNASLRLGLSALPGGDNGNMGIWKKVHPSVNTLLHVWRWHGGMGGSSLERTHCLFWTLSKSWTATQRSWVYSKQWGMGQVKGMYSPATGNSTLLPQASRIPHFTRLQSFGVNTHTALGWN